MVDAAAPFEDVAPEPACHEIVDAISLRWRKPQGKGNDLRQR